MISVPFLTIPQDDRQVFVVLKRKNGRLFQIPKLYGEVKDLKFFISHNTVFEYSGMRRNQGIEVIFVECPGKLFIHNEED